MVPKFRGWDRKNHVMYDFMMMCFNVNLKNVLYRNNLTDFDVDMYTGLKDVNGKEIYEGDIVVPVMTILGKVKRMAHPFEVRASHYVYEKWIATYVSDRGFGVDGWYTGHQMEVIGNIHENPELLEAQHE